MERARALLIDDSPTIRKLVELTLRAAGWSVALATSGQAGIASALASPVDLVVLDYVLPDMRGIDVCARLAAEPRTAGVPIVVVSAKSDEVRAQFEPFASVMACLPKPFTTEQLRKIANAAIAGRDRETTSFTRAHRETAAQELFTALRSAFAGVPRWAAELGDAAPASFFARKVLTAERIDAVLDGLLPLYRELFASRPRLLDAERANVRGELSAWPLSELLNFFAASGRAGELALTCGETSLVTYWRGGGIVLVSTNDPDEYLSGVPLGRIPPAHLARAKAEQRASSKPALVTLAEEGVALPQPLGDLLHRQGRRILLDALDTKTATFAWRDRASLPLYVEAHGRHVSTARNTLVFRPPSPDAAAPSSLEQLALERLRRAPALAVVRDDAVFDRLRGLVDRVARLDLDACERRVLAATDGVVAVTDIAARVAMPAADVAKVLARLADVGLVGERATLESGSRPVLILEPDVEGFQRPLELLLRNRARDTAVVSLEGERDIVGAIRRERPRLVILNAAMIGDAMVSTAVRVRGEGALADVSLVAVLEAHGAREEASLRAAGFDAVFVKPVPYADLERLID